jgi:hypothetical protein
METNNPKLGLSNELTRKLIHAAETQPWSDELRYALALGCKYRNIAFSSWDNCGDLADALEASLVSR